MSFLAVKLAKKIQKDCGIMCYPAKFERTYAGKNMKAAGAFVWTIGNIGSTEPASELVKSKYKLNCFYSDGDIEIFGEKVVTN